ncbi:MAG: DUF1566 domain-containing protein [Chrysiogenales bacterium]|nr:MAG: DUF1566 domain-containing protein [Chrysiogenales bacterium]
MWQQSPSTSDRTFSDTITYVAGLPLGGYNDWRVPNVNELQSLMNARAPAVYTWLNSEGFSNIVFPFA